MDNQITYFEDDYSIDTLPPQMSADGGAVAVEVPGKFVDACTFAVALSNLPDFIVREIFLLLMYLSDDIIRVVGSICYIGADLR